MARNFNGGTDRIAWSGLPDISTVSGSTLAFRMRTTQATANVQLTARASATSRAGFFMLLNGTANKLTYAAYDGTTQRVAFTGATTVNDGNWHSVIVLLDARSGFTNYVHLDGTLEGSGNSSANWGSTGTHLTFGDSFDPFWPSYVGDIADVGYWAGIHLTADEIAAYSKGFSAGMIRRSSLSLYAPLVNDHQDRRGNPIAGSGFSGTTAASHAPVLGSLT